MNNTTSDNSILPSPHVSSDNSHQTPVDAHINSGSAIAVSQNSQRSTDLPLNAGDIDLIEKEWVTKAKAIVASTIGDPRRQSDELSNMKKQYIAKRFNKELPNND